MGALTPGDYHQPLNVSFEDHMLIPECRSGPVVDGLFAPAIPGKLLLQGSYDHDLTLMLGHNADEGLEFTNPGVTNDTTLNEYVLQAFPTIQSSVASYIENVLYPPVMPGTLGLTGYSDETGRVDLIVSESTFTYDLPIAFHCC